MRPNQEMIQRVRTAFDTLKTRYFRASHLNSRGHKHGPNFGKSIITKRKMRYEARERKTGPMSFGDKWQNDATYRKSQQHIGWSDAWVRYLDHIEQIDISHNAPHEQRGRYHNLIYLRSMDEDRQAPPLSTRPGHEEAKTALAELQKRSRQDINVVHIPPTERTRLNDKLDPEMRRYLEWLSMN